MGKSRRSLKSRSQQVAPSEAVQAVRLLHDSGKVAAAAKLADQYADSSTSKERPLLLLFKGMAIFETGAARAGIAILKEAVGHSAGTNQEIEFATTLSLFTRESQFQPPADVLPEVGQVRQLAASLGNRNSIAGLHLAVARQEAYRGHCQDARRHVEIARTAAAGLDRATVRGGIDLVDSSLETIAGNLDRARQSAKNCFEIAAQN